MPLIGAIILLVFMILDSTPGENRFGPNPKGEGASDASGSADSAAPAADGGAKHQVYRGDDLVGEYTAAQIKAALGTGAIVSTDYVWDPVANTSTAVEDIS